MGVSVPIPASFTSLWFVCKTCKNSFNTVDQFLGHKYEKHSIELKRVKRVVFEEKLLDLDQSQNTQVESNQACQNQTQGHEINCKTPERNEFQLQPETNNKPSSTDSHLVPNVVIKQEPEAELGNEPEFTENISEPALNCYANFDSSTSNALNTNCDLHTNHVQGFQATHIKREVIEFEEVGSILRIANPSLPDPDDEKDSPFHLPPGTECIPQSELIHGKPTEIASTFNFNHGVTVTTVESDHIYPYNEDQIGLQNKPPENDNGNNLGLGFPGQHIGWMGSNKGNDDCDINEPCSSSNISQNVYATTNVKCEVIEIPESEGVNDFNERTLNSNVVPNNYAPPPMPIPRNLPLSFVPQPQMGGNGNSFRAQQHFSSEQVRTEGLRTEQFRSEQLRVEQLRREQLRNTQLRAEQLRNDQVRAEQLRTEQLRNGHFRVAQLTPEQLRVQQLRAQQLRIEHTRTRVSVGGSMNVVARDKNKPPVSLVCPHPNCNKLFKNEILYRQHVFLHSQVRKYMCPVNFCNKTFASKRCVERHAVVHTQYRPFKCVIEGCGKAFKREDHLTQHMRNIHKPS